MKKFVSLLLSFILLTVSCSALASTISVGNTGLTLSISNDFDEDSLTQDDINDGIVGYWYNDNIDLAIIVNDDDYTVDDLLSYYSSDNTVTKSGIISNGPAGLRFGYIQYSDTDDNGDKYYGIEYFTEYSGSLIEFCFYMYSTRYSSEAESIMQTLSAYGNTSYVSGASYSNPSGSIALGNTGLSFSLPSGYTTEQLTSEDIADDMVGYWCTDYLDVILYVYSSGYSSLNEIQSDLAAESDVVSSGITTMSNGMSYAYCVIQDPEDTEYTEIDYITLYRNDTVHIIFAMYTDEAAEASAEAAQIMDSIR